MDQLSNVKFKFKSETKIGQNIHIVGNHPQLGSWDPARSIKLLTDPYSYPFWTTPIIQLPFNSTIEYKYLFITPDSCTWEQFPNRKLFLSQKKVVIEDSSESGISKVFYSDPDFTKTEELFHETSSFTNQEQVFIVTFTLPVIISKDINGNWDFKFSRSVWQSQFYNILLTRENKFLWFGLSNYQTESEAEQEELQSIMKERYHCIPVFIESGIIEEHEKFCSMVLYKLLHNIIDSSVAALNCNEKLWTSYKRFNIIFSENLLSHHTNQMIWIHGPQFFLLPSYISRKTKEIMNIGFFLHHPFPSSEIYRMFPYREAILHALCCCDMIGFHLFEYARNFLSCCKRILSLNMEPTKGGYLGLNYFGRYIMVRSEHIGIQPEIIKDIQNSPETLSLIKELELKYQGKIVILSIDAAHELAGIPMKFQAFQLASKNFREKVVLVQILVPQQTLSECLKIKEQVVHLADEINKEANDVLIEIISKDIGNEERYAFMKLSRGLVISCVKDGLCLQPFEYLIIKQESCKIALSEFTGVSTALNSPRKVNPFNIQDLKEAIEEIVNENISEDHISTIQKDIKYIYSHDTNIWIEKFLKDLKKAHKDTNNLHYLIHGLGDKLKLIALRKNFKKLNKRKIFESYSQSNNRVLIFDNEGTLSNFMKQNEINKKIGPSSRILKALDLLCEEEKNTVFVITGRPREVVENWFGSISNLGLAAEYGAKVRLPASRKWETHFSIKSNWKSTAREIMTSYSERTEGSFIVEKESSVVFHYREAEVELGSYQAKELVSHLDFLLQPFMDEIEISEGIGYVEVKPFGINKGTALFRVIENAFETKGPVDFILAIGDDNSDEDMFKMARLLKKQKSRTLLHPRIPTFTCTLGIKPSSAGFYLLDANKVVELLEFINGESKRAKRNFSSDDLWSRQKIGSLSKFKFKINVQHVDQLENSQSEDDD